VRLRAFATNPYLPCVAAGYALAGLGVTAPAGLATAGRDLLLLNTLPAFAAAGGALAGHDLRPDRTVLRLAAARMTIAAVPLALLRLVLPIPFAFVLLAGMAVGMGGLGVAALYGIPTRRLVPTLAFSTMLVLATAAVAPVARMA
jgi:hypothetical protein